MTWDLTGKRGLILGVANKWSIAWAIAEQVAHAGARLVITYQNERLKRGVEKLVSELSNASIEECDVSQPSHLERLRDTLKEGFGSIDFIVHSIAFAAKEDLVGPFYKVPRERFLQTIEISAYSLVAVTRELLSLFSGGGSIVAMTYLGGERVVPNYNVMGVAKAALDAIVRYLANDLGPLGVRVNAISAGPIKTLAAAGISDFQKMLDHNREHSPLRRNISQEDVARAATFLLSDASGGITGSTLYVDSGFHIMAV